MYVWNAIFDYQDLMTYSSGDYIQSASTIHFLTNKLENGIDIQIDERDYMYGITFTSGDIYYLRVDTYTSDGVAIDNYFIANPYQAADTDAKKFYRFGCGPANLNALTYGVDFTSTGGSTTIIGTNVGYYYVQTRKFNGTRTSQQYKYNIVDQCTKTANVRFHFLNKLGGYDGFTFQNITKHGVDIKRDLYKKQLGDWRTVNTYFQTVSDRADVQYNTNLKDSYTATSIWISEAECIWLEELYTSPDVYVDINGDEIPVTITSNKYDVKYEGNEKLFNLTIEYQFSYDRYRQRY